MLCLELNAVLPTKVIRSNDDTVLEFDRNHRRASD